VKQEGPASPNRFSKTFGQEKNLDAILAQLDESQNNDLNEDDLLKDELSKESNKL